MKDILNTLSELLIKADAKMDPQSRMMDVASEVGELSKEVLKSTRYGRKEFTMTSEFEEEYGDVLYSLLSMGLENGIDIESNIKKMIKKMNSRFGIEEDDLSPNTEEPEVVTENKEHKETSIADYFKARTSITK